MDRLYTIGHSTHTIERFIELLSMHSIDAVCDVRSSPHSRFNPQYNRKALQQELMIHGIEYVYIGKELGPRSKDSSCYVNGKVQYDRLAKTEIFREGIERLKNVMAVKRVALMCGEKDPIMCHRMILVCRYLHNTEFEIKHIMADGSEEDNYESEKRLMEFLKIPEQTLFDSDEDMINRAYSIQGERIAYIIKG